MDGFKALFFDMDGLLIDSEPIWRKVEMEVFAGVGLSLSEEDCACTTGLRIDEVCNYWKSRRDWGDPSAETLAQTIIEAMIKAVLREGTAMKGAISAVHAASNQGVPLALVTSSPLSLAEATLKKLDLQGAFTHVISAFELDYGKPHPGVYLKLIEKLGCPPMKCVAFEDSLNGVLAAKSGRLYCAAVPAAEDRLKPQFSIADCVLPSLEVVDDAWFRDCASKMKFGKVSLPRG